MVFKYITCPRYWIICCLHCIKLFSAEIVETNSRCLPCNTTGDKEILREWNSSSPQTKNYTNSSYLCECFHNLHTKSKSVSLPFMRAKFGNKKESTSFTFHGNRTVFVNVIKREGNVQFAERCLEIYMGEFGPWNLILKELKLI